VRDGQRGQELLNKKCGNASGEIAVAVQRFGDQVEAVIEACTGAANLAKSWPRKPSGASAWDMPALSRA